MTRITRDIHGEVKRDVYACMETGNFERAGLLMREYKAQFSEQAEALRLQLVRDYGKEV